jgi:hypothetical protein
MWNFCTITNFFLKNICDVLLKEKRRPLSGSLILTKKKWPYLPLFSVGGITLYERRLRSADDNLRTYFFVQRKISFAQAQKEFFLFFF